MPLDRKPGRKCPDVFGFPAGCTGLSGDCLQPCTADFRNWRCLGCIRIGDVPLPKHWELAAINIVGTRSVQIIGMGGRPKRWLVVAFVAGFLVDSRFPVVACATKAEAVDLALLRGRQIKPFAAIEHRGDGDWHMGDLLIWGHGDGFQ